MITVVLVVADRSGWLLVRRPDDMIVYHGTMTRVIRVVDGDTLEVDLPDRLQGRPYTRVRLWGIDSPELAGLDRPAEAFAEEARELVRTLAEGRTAILTLEAHRPRGAFGRVLAHVQIRDSTNLNETLLAAGLARADDRWPHSRLAHYAQVERAAQRRKVGIWGRTVLSAP